MFGVPPNTLPLVIYIGRFKTIAVGLIVLSDGMVHFLKIEKNFNKSTKAILWL